MLQKNIDKQKQKDRATWSLYYERVTNDKSKQIPRKKKYKGGKCYDEI